MLPEPSRGTQVQAHPSQLSRRLSGVTTPFLSESESAALLGASLAFRKTSNPPTFTLNTHSGTNGARAAAITAGRIKQLSNEHDKLLHAHHAAGGGHENIGPLAAAQRSMTRENMRKDMSSTMNSKRTAESVPTAKSSPSDIAAVVASSKDSQERQLTAKRDGHIRTSGNSNSVHEFRLGEPPQTGSKQGIRPQALRKGHNLQDNQRIAKTISQNSGVETDHVAPTASLIQLFERSAREADGTHTTAPKLTVSSPAILSPKPVRPISLANVPLTAALAAAQNLSGRCRSFQDANPILHSDGNTHLSSTARPMSAKRSFSRQTSYRSMSQEAKSTGPSTAMPMRGKDTPSLPSAPKSRTVQTTESSSTSNRAPSVDTQKLELRRTKSSVPSVHTTSRPLISPLREESRSNINSSYQSPSAELTRTDDLPGLDISERQLLPTRRSMTSLMTESSLADAIVASSLASSRAPSPYTLSKTPLSRRRSRSRHMFQHHHHNPQLNSRTPSPPKAMRHTMRKQHDSDEEEDDELLSRRRRKNHFLNKHPNKHREGSRKRWRDVVTERELKRYEGVWAANKGIYISVDSHPIKSSQPHQLSSLVAESLVLNLVVRDIWSRSRLGNEVLEEIWDLVDRKGLGLLDREEFVVGMWLTDQRLKGRKLPVKVSMSVWDSVRALRGIKIPKRKT